MVKQRSGASLVVVVLLAIVIVAAVVGFVVWQRGANQTTFVGDSITDQMRGKLEQRFRTDDDHLKAVGGKTIGDMTPPAQELAQLSAKQAVVNLGTNDVLLGRPIETSDAELVALLGAYANRSCVHVVTINERMVSPDGRDTLGPAMALNNTMRSWAAQDPAHHKVIDWAKIVIDYDNAGKPEGALTLDTVHPTELGEQKLLDAYNQSLSACSS